MRVLEKSIGENEPIRISRSNLRFVWTQGGVWENEMLKRHILKRLLSLARQSQLLETIPRPLPPVLEEIFRIGQRLENLL